MTTPTSIGRYQIRHEIGRGGMATVFQAYDPQMDRDVAIKVLPRAYMHDPTFRGRFEREAETVAKLDHPNIVPVYEFGEDDRQPYLVMRLMQGGSLTERLQKGPMSFAQALPILQVLASALDTAHRSGVVHRDLKPDNILFDQFDVPYLTDFGIAKLAESNATLTGVGAIGTPEYMSPEQVQGSQQLDGRSDVYALGIILYEMLAGVRPFSAESGIALLIQHVNKNIPNIVERNSSLPRATQDLIERALAKSPSARFQSAGALYSAATQVASGKSLGKRRVPVFALASAALVLLGGITAFLLITGTSRAPSNLVNTESILAAEIKPTAAIASTETGQPEQPELTEVSAVATSTIAPTLPPATNTPQSTATAILLETSEPVQTTVAPTPTAASSNAVRITRLNVDLLAPVDYITQPAGTALSQPTLPSWMTGLNKVENRNRTASFEYRNSGGELVSNSRIDIPNYFERDSELSQLAWSSTGEYVAAAGGPNGSGDILILNAATGDVERWLAGHPSNEARGEFFLPHDIAWSSDGTRLASTGDDGTIRIWDATYWDERRNQELLTIGVKGGLSADIDWSPNNDVIASYEHDGVIRFYSALSGSLLFWIADADPTSCTRDCDRLFDFSADGSTIRLEGRRDIAWRVVDAPNVAETVGDIEPIDLENFGRMARTASLGAGHVRSIDFAPNSQLLAIAATRGVYFYSTQTWQEAYFLPTDTPPHTIQFTSDSQAIAISFISPKVGIAEIWSFADETLLHSWSAHPIPIKDMVMAPNGEILATTSLDAVKLWKLPDPELFRTFNANDAKLAYSRDNTLAAFDDGSGLLLKEVIDNKLVAGGVPINAAASEIDFANTTGYSFMLTVDRNSAQLWNTKSAHLHRSLDVAELDVRDGVLSPINRLLFLATRNQLHVWNALSGEHLAIFSHKWQPNELKISNDGSALAVMTTTGRVEIWQVSK